MILKRQRLCIYMNYSLSHFLSLALHTLKFMAQMFTTRGKKTRCFKESKCTMSDLVQKHHAIVISNSVHHSKKMAAVHFTTIPCELNTTKETNHRHIFTTIVRVLTILCTSALTFLTFLCIFISLFSVFSVR